MSGPSLDELIAAEREAPPVPSSEGARAGWQRIEKSMAAGAAAPFDLPPGQVAPVTGIAAWSTAAKVVVAAVVMAGGATVGIGLRSGASDSAKKDAVAIAVHSQPDIEAQPDGIESAGATMPAPEAAIVGSEPDATRTLDATDRANGPTNAADTDAADTDAPMNAAEPDATGDPSSAAETSDPPRSSAPPARAESKVHGGIGREIDMIRRATEAVNRGRYQRALTILGAHARVFTDGAMAEDREALRAIARCGLGKGPDTATSFHDRYPGSMHGKRVDEACSHNE